MKPLEKEIIEFSILKELSYNNYIPSANDYGISNDVFVSLFKHMVSMNLLDSRRLIFNILGTVEIDNEYDLVTSLGNKYIQEHEGWNAIYNDIGDLDKLLRRND